MNESIESGEIETWTVDKDGDYTHKPVQWRNKAWISVSDVIPRETVIFGIISRRFVKMTKDIYAVYHGRFSEMLLAHFDTLIEKIEISALPTEHDKLTDL